MIRWRGEGFSQALSKSSMQREKVNVLDGGLLALAVRGILAGSAFGLANPHPVGRLVAGPGKASPLHECLQQINGVAVLALPICADPPQDQAQDMAGQARRVQPGYDKESGVVGDHLQPGGPRRGIPSDMLVAVRTLPGGRAKEQAGHRAAGSFPRQILEVLPHRAAVTQIVELMEQGFKKPAVDGGHRADFPQVQREEVGQWSFEEFLTDGRIQRRHLLVPHSIGRRPATGWLPDQASLLQLEQERSGRHVLELS
jgi:hypothetical protein